MDSNLLLQINPRTRQLNYLDGTPLFLLADTAWEIFHRLDRQQADHYLNTRASQGFNAVMAVVLSELDSIQGESNAFGEFPFIGSDPDLTNDLYFDHIDFVISRANQLGLIVVLLPTWGDKWHDAYGCGPVIFNPANAFRYGQFVARRFRQAGIVWALGGDRRPETTLHNDIIKAMALGIRTVDGGRRLITLHPKGGDSSADYFPETPWIDFHMRQSGHCEDAFNWQSLSHDSARELRKPFMDGEPMYEHHPIMSPDWKTTGLWWDAFHSRRAGWWAALSGVCGHAYGCHDVWQMFDPHRGKPINGAHLPWQDALHLPGARQVALIRRFIERGAYYDRVAAANAIESNVSEAAAHVQVCHVPSVNSVLAYLPTSQPIQLRLTESIHEAFWFHPREGNYQSALFSTVDGLTKFEPPCTSVAIDWVLEIKLC